MNGCVFCFLWVVSVWPYDSVSQPWGRDPFWGHLEYIWGRLQYLLTELKFQIIIFKIMIRNTTQNLKQPHSLAFMNMNQVKIKCSI